MALPCTNTTIDTPCTEGLRRVNPPKHSSVIIPSLNMVVLNNLFRNQLFYLYKFNFRRLDRNRIESISAGSFSHLKNLEEL